MEHCHTIVVMIEINWMGNYQVRVFEVVVHWNGQPVPPILLRLYFVKICEE